MTNRPITPQTMSVADVARELGLDRRTARKLFDDHGGDIPRIRNTSRVITTRVAFDRFLETPNRAVEIVPLPAVHPAA